tara:strand:- start:6258 stop:8342 length:2085 start_codon:yes stop_codon:yes gene_type:complete
MGILGLLARGGQTALGALRAGRAGAAPLLKQVVPTTQNILKSASNQGSRFIRGAKQSSGRPLTGSSAEIGRKTASAVGSLGQATKVVADDIAVTAQAALNAAKGTSTAAKAAAVQKAILTKYPAAGEVAASLAARIKSGTTSLKGLDIAGALRSSPAFLQTLGANTKSGIQTLATSPMVQKLANSRLGKETKNILDKFNRATNPAVKNQAADDAFGSVMAQGRNIGSQIGSGISNQFNRLKSGIGSFLNSTPTGRQSLQNFSYRTGSPSYASQFPRGAYRGPTNTTVGSTQIPYGSSYAANSGLTKTTAQTMDDLGIPASRGIRDLLNFSRPSKPLLTTPTMGLMESGVPTYTLGSVGRGLAGATGRGLKGIGSFSMKHPFIAGGLGTAGVMYGPDAYDAATTAMFGKSPEQQFRQGVGSLMGTEENRRRTLGDLGALYAQGELGEAIGTPGARNLSQQQMRQYLGGSIFGDEGYANIPMRGGTGVFGGEGSSTMAGDIFNNPARESIMKNFGMQMNDEEIMEKYAEILDKQRKKESLDAEDLQFLMMFEALSKPTNLPTDQFRRNAGFESARARQDVQNQLGGQFEVIDYNQLYPTYAQPQTAINMAEGGEAFPDLNNDGELTYADILKGRGVDLRDGGEASGPGTGTSDSIPARLSDGEFVMTAEAVRNAGDGDRKQGVRKMYALMNSLEGR